MFATDLQTISDIQVEGISAAVWRAWTTRPLFPELSIVTATAAKPPIPRCVCLYSQDGQAGEGSAGHASPVPGGMGW